MKPNVAQESRTLAELTMPELRARFAEVHGEATATGNRAWLMRRILWRMQALAEGDLSERARQRAAELANDADLRVMPPVARETQPAPEVAASPRLSARQHHTGLPAVGSLLRRAYKGMTLEVRVLSKGFEFDGTTYTSLSAVARAITGAHWNGRRFFGLGAGGEQ
jgi:Protein of unknown function (DUF2924)